MFEPTKVTYDGSCTMTHYLGYEDVLVVLFDGEGYLYLYVVGKYTEKNLPFLTEEDYLT